jgi:Flp pilus assembly protein TadB
LVIRLFYYLFFPLCAGFLALFLWQLSQRWMALSVVRARDFQRKHSPQRVASFSKVFRITLFALPLLGMAVTFLLWERPLLGLFSLILLPLIAILAVALAELQERKGLEKSSLSFFYTLQGMISAGQSLPSSLFEISQRQKSPFTTALGRELGKYAEGKPFEEALQRFADRYPLGSSGLCFRLMTEAYGRGLQISPLMERMIPLLEIEIQGKQRVESLRASTLAQAVVVVLAPWLLFGALSIFQPETAQRFLHSTHGSIALAVAVLFEATGAYVLWRVSSFY